MIKIEGTPEEIAKLLQSLYPPLVFDLSEDKDTFCNCKNKEDSEKTEPPRKKIVIGKETILQHP